MHVFKGTSCRMENIPKQVHLDGAGWSFRKPHTIVASAGLRAPGGSGEAKIVILPLLLVHGVVEMLSIDFGSLHWSMCFTLVGFLLHLSMDLHL
jgi:hypothetical protein